MAAPLWKSYAARPFGVAGAATFLAWVEVPGETVQDVRALVGLVPPVGHDDASAVRVDLPLLKNSPVFVQDLPDGACTVAWFVRSSSSGWVAGPVQTVDFSAAWDANFAYLKDWAARTLSRLERERMPLGAERKVHIRTSFPRDTFPMPCVSVQFEAVPQVNPMLGNFAAAPAAQIAQERVPWSMSLSVLLWCETPEERDQVTPWFLQAMTALGSLAPHVGLAEPSYNFNESEDFSGTLMEKPLFITTCSLSGTVWSELKVAAHNYKGHMTI